MEMEGRRDKEEEERMLYFSVTNRAEVKSSDQGKEVYIISRSKV